MDIPSGTREVFLTRWFRLMEKSGESSSAPYYWIESPDCVTVLAVTADGRVPLIRQFRLALDRESLELPAATSTRGPDAGSRRAT